MFHCWIKVIPNASQNGLGAVMPYKEGRMLKVYIQAPAVDGKANRMLIEFLAERLGVRKHEIEIVHGLTQPIKRIACPVDLFSLVDSPT